MVEEKPCRHEFVKIFQRKLKGLERRLVVRKAWLPTGFKMTDLAHLGEGSYCFCSNCRARLYPKRSQAEKAALRQAQLASKLAKRESDLAAEAMSDMDGGEDLERAIDVEELELESPDVQDIQAEGVKLDDNLDACETVMEEDL